MSDRLRGVLRTVIRAAREIPIGAQVTGMRISPREIRVQTEVRTMLLGNVTSCLVRGATAKDNANSGATRHHAEKHRKSEPQLHQRIDTSNNQAAG